MNRFLAAMAAVASLCAFGASAQAATYTLSPNTLSPDTTSTSPTVNHKNSGKTDKTFTDDFTFKLSSADEGLFTAAFNNLASAKYSITSADLTIFSGIPASGSEVSSTGWFNTASGSPIPTLTADLAAGAYYIEASVLVPHGDTGSYSIFATAVSAAPEPSSWLLMIVGVGLAGVMVRRRGQQAVLAA